MLIKIKPVTLSPSFVKPAVVADYANVGGASIQFDPPGASGSVQLGTVDAEGNFLMLDGGATVAMTQEQFDAWGTDNDIAARQFVENYGLVMA
jgi:hypothetical protein